MPKNLVSSGDNAGFIILQLEMHTQLGIITQCSDMIVQKVTGFSNQKCDPHCKNGGVCQSGKCKCGINFSGDACETKNGASGAFSFLLFIFVIILVLVAFGLLYFRANLEKEQQRNLAQGSNDPGPVNNYAEIRRRD